MGTGNNTLAARAVRTANPEIRRIDIADLKDAIVKGLADFNAMPTHYFYLAIIYPIVTFAIAAFYGELDFRVPTFADVETGMTNIDVLVALDIHPPLLTIDMNRVFFVDGVRRRENIPHSGLVLTDDEYVEIKSVWATPVATPLNRSEISLNGRQDSTASLHRTANAGRVLGKHAADQRQVTEVA